ncbi:MAG TPA: hypothetical protein PLX56_02600 [bacterium]|nr:hypothetical protein [bacterium]HQN73089.1 hypothetical protein [bacterium]HQO91193.1 hypothetical protein [bacterium]
MRNFLTITAVLMFSFFMVSCGDEDPKLNLYDDENEATDEEETGDIEETSDNEQIDKTAVRDEEETNDETITVPDDGPDENIEIPDETAFQKTGEFSLNFTGQINVDLSNYTNIKGGDGITNFSHNGAQLSFGKLTVIIVQLFPIAILQQNNVAILWLDSAPGLGAETKQVFGFTFPSTIQPGNTTMEAAQAFAFYGDIDINLQGGQFDVKCVRSAAIAGQLNMNSYTGTNADFTASGDLLDPSAAGSQLPYPVCTD